MKSARITGPLAAFLVAAWLVQALGRLVMLGWHHALLSQQPAPWDALPTSLLLGLRWDAGVAVVLLLLAAPAAFFHGTPARLWHRVLLFVVAALGTVDVFFLGYFHDRFNRLAWDVFRDAENARLVLQSLPVELPLPSVMALLAASLFTAWLMHHALLGALSRHPRIILFTAAAVALLGLLHLPTMAQATIPPFAVRHAFLNTLQDNSLLALWRARKQLAHEDMDASRPPTVQELQRAAATVSPSSRVTSDEKGLEYQTAAHGHSRLLHAPRHVVLVVMESMSAWPLEEEELGLGNAVAPNLRALTSQSLSFTRHFPAEGGTLRNLHTLLTSNPTPGVSTTTLAGTMQSLGYQPVFFYGGSYAWEGMSSWLPQLGFPDLAGGIGAPEDLAAGLGMPDEDLFKIVLSRLERATSNTFSVVLTTSNHPPFELPASYQPRAVYLPQALRPRTLDPIQARRRFQSFQYADHALGTFLAAARERPFYDDTLFIITGDHAFPGTLTPDPARSLVEDRVPLLFHAPKLLQPAAEAFQHSTSHMDLLPSLVDLLASKPMTVPSWGKSVLETGRPFFVAGLALACREDRCVEKGLSSRILPNLTLVPEPMDAAASSSLMGLGRLLGVGSSK